MRNSHHDRSNAGFTIIELMVTMVLGIIILGGVVSLFASSRKSYENNDQLAQLQENGRLALGSIVRDIRSAGYKGCAKAVPFFPDPSPPGLFLNFANPIFGFESVDDTNWSPVLDPAVISPVQSPKSRSDVLVLRIPDGTAIPQLLNKELLPTDTSMDLDDLGAAPDLTGPASAAFKAGGGQYVLVSSCLAASVVQTTSYASGTLNFIGSTGHQFPKGARVIPMHTVIYYIRAGADNLRSPASLWKNVDGVTDEELVEGVDSLQFEYGVDTNGDSLVDKYVTADLVGADWPNVLSVRVGLLVRSLTEYGADKDSAARNILAQPIPAFGDRRQRQIFTTTATLRNAI